MLRTSPMSHLVLRRLLSLLLGVVALIVVGCPSSTPPRAAPGSGTSAEATAGELKEKVEDIASLKAAKAFLETDSAGHVVAVELNRDSGSDADLAHLKGLP